MEQLENQNQNQNNKIIKFNDIEYEFDSLPDEAKELIQGLQVADMQLKMYGDTQKLISISRDSMLKKLQSLLNDSSPKDVKD